ncbi:CU044_5270 family protein [Nonomuraea sp. NPDC050536]|uniref:CU044_5270 family protein n=1 Tax=Nonomuraea sp. NPDC050536 TaxID=3364366 RepID=UPI0037C72E65
MDDEIQFFAQGRPAAPPYPSEARDRARDRLLEEARGGRAFTFRFPRLGWQAAAAFGVTVTLVGGVAVALSGQQGGGVASPAAVASVVPPGLPGDLNPQAGQYILVESDTMYTSESMGKDGASSHWLYRTHRKIWQSVDGSKDGLLMIQGLPAKPWPGEKLPKEALAEGKGETPWWSRLAACPQRLGDARRDYAYLSTLPTDPAQLRTRFYQHTDTAGKDVSVDDQAWESATELLNETYMPKAQRDAYFEALKSIPGVKVAEGVEDSAGRKGVALGRVAHGQLVQFIFDPDSHLLMGERATVVDAGVAKAPEGSVMALTAQTSITAVDSLPVEAKSEGKDASCDPQNGEQFSSSMPSASEPPPLPTDEATITATMEASPTLPTEPPPGDDPLSESTATAEPPKNEVPTDLPS